jgi:hypothetical protein
MRIGLGDGRDAEMFAHDATGHGDEQGLVVFEPALEAPVFT